MLGRLIKPLNLFQVMCEKEDDLLKASSETLITHLASLHGALETSEK